MVTLAIALKFYRMKSIKQTEQVMKADGPFDKADRGVKKKTEQYEKMTDQ